MLNRDLVSAALHSGEVAEHYLTPTVETALDALSLKVVHLARREPADGLAGRGFWGRLHQRLVGNDQAPRPLANPRLEALRRFCILSREGHPQGTQLRQDLLSAGHYDASQLDQALRISREASQTSLTRKAA